MAGVSSGVGKTTVATGLMAALRSRGVRVSAAKVGPDFIDPGYHALATGRPGRNLDTWICGEAALLPLAARAALDSDVLIVEGVMGLFDGAATDGPDASTASVARMLDAPVVLVVDASAMSRSVAAIVHGFATFDPDVRLAGVILNRVGSPGHLERLTEALGPVGVPVLGSLRRDDSVTWRDRHLGLVPVAERPDAVGAALDRLAATVASGIDLDAVMALARSAPSLTAGPVPLPEPVASARVAVAGGPAFTFVYRDNLEALCAAGAELESFDPLADRALPPDCQAVYVGGGFPEVYAAALGANSELLSDVRARMADGLVVWAECGGLLWLAQSLDGVGLVGAIPAVASMTPKLSLGYAVARVAQVSPLAGVGCVLRGHEFHYSTVAPPGDALEMTSRHGTRTGGYAGPRLLASYLHLHLGGDPAPARRFVAAAAAVGPPTAR